MMFLANPVPGTRPLMETGVIGFIDTPLQGNKRPDGVVWCADNGCYGKGFTEEKWWQFLVKHSSDASKCLFATAPDVVGDAEATLKLSLPWLPRIRAIGYRAAFVAQDGLEDLDVPWDEFDCLFIGGTTEWKLGPHVRQLIGEAKALGKWVHCGRVNSRKRYRYFQAIGGDSCDGTYLIFGPDTNLPSLLGWVREIPLFDFKEST